MTSNLLYVDVDTQFDFCDPEGALFVKGAPAILDNVRRLIRSADERGAILVGSVDSHDFTAWEFAANGGPFPPHCVKGTRGWLKMSGTLLDATTFVPCVAGQDPTEVVKKQPSAVLFEKEVYSLFVNPVAETTLDALLADRNLTRSDAPAIVFGVATDYCVKAAALGLRERGFCVRVVDDAIAPVDPATGEAARTEMIEAGCTFVSTESVL